MQIYINKNGQQLGPFEEAKVLEMLRNGQLLRTDYGIKKGEEQWQNLGNLFPQLQTATEQPLIAPVTQEPPQVSGRLSIIRVSFAALFIISFIAAHALAFMMGPKFISPDANPMLWFGASALMLVLCALLLLLLILGIGTKNGMSRWRTPLFCVLVMIWSFGLGSFVYSKVSSASVQESWKELEKIMKDKGFSETDGLSQIAFAGKRRGEALGQLNYGLLGLGGISLFGTGISLIISTQKSKRK